MFPRRENEPDYAVLNDPVVKDLNRYGLKIDLLERSGEPEGVSFRINGDEGVGDNPNRYKQHGFHFTADNCIGCHACEAACSEKNDLPPHLSFRAVGFVEGGSYPDFNRINISMACNHCDDPVCLKGCPTRAYTKYAEYGAVLQDPDICFGCGYCTWVCPYNAPQLDPIEGQVQKCNMCVDRLEVGLKPACVAACLGNALNFGVIENVPERREHIKTEIPGFPTPDISNPNIRFQLTKSLARVFTRGDNAAIQYKRDDKTGRYIPGLDLSRAGDAIQANWKKLLTSHENAHIAFTLASQMVMGAFLYLIAGTSIGLSEMSFAKESAYLPLVGVMFAIMTYGLVRLNLHLGKPHRFYRGFNNLRWSPVSREIAGVTLFFMGFCGYAFMTLAGQFLPNLALVTEPLSMLAAAVGLIGGAFGLYYMIKLYLIPARPFWNHPQTATSFIGTVLTLGAALVALVTSLTTGLEASSTLIRQLAQFAAFGLVIEGLGLIAHDRHMTNGQNEGAVSHYEQKTKYGIPYLVRNGLLAANLIACLLIAAYGLPEAPLGAYLGAGLLISLAAMAVIGRALFYVLVIPTTMPGAFFWKNKGFQELARESGLAHMPQVGVVPDGH